MVFVLVFGVFEDFTSLGPSRPIAFFPLPLGSTGRVQGRLLLFWLKCANKLAVDEAVVHDATRRPMDGVGPALDARRVLLVDQNGSGSEHLCALLVVWPATDMTKTSLECGLDYGHGIFGRI